jgi:hypothetical protein
MKKKLLLFIFAMGIIGFANAQVIDLIGKGVFGEATANLPLTNINNITKVDVAVITKGDRDEPLSGPNDVTFNNALNENPATNFDGLNYDYATIITDWFPIGAYTATFNTFDANGVDAYLNTDYGVSFYAYVYRNDPSATYKSYRTSNTTEEVFFFRNGSNDPYVYNIPIDAASGPRNITVKIPISEMKDDERLAIIDITAGPETAHDEINTYDVALGNSLFIGEYTLTNVPGNVTNVEVNIYSPDNKNEDPGVYGDSFFVSGVIADVDIVTDDPGCTLTQGYWKTHSSCKTNGNGPERDDTWDALPSAESTEFFLSGQDYCEVFATTPRKGGKYYILAHQYIAAQLNILSGASGSSITAAYGAATDFLNMYTPDDVKNSQELQAKAVELGAVLDDYNNGFIGPGHCDDEGEEESLYSENIVVAPNPISSQATISMTADRDGDVVVNLYDSYGALVSLIYNNFVYDEEKISIDLNASAFANGMYYIKIWNGDVTVTKTVVIEH